MFQYHSAHSRATDELADMAERYRQVVSQNYGLRAELQGLRAVVQQQQGATGVRDAADGLLVHDC